MLSRQAALALVHEYTASESLRRHMYAVEIAMRAMAREQGADEEAWGIVGLLHDFDYERFPNEQRSATAEHPALRVGAEHLGCSEVSGRFVVLELVRGPGDEIVSFAADFTQRCGTDTGLLRGSVRYRVGDQACAAAADTPGDRTERA